MKYIKSIKNIFNNFFNEDSSGEVLTKSGSDNIPSNKFITEPIITREEPHISLYMYKNHLEMPYISPNRDLTIWTAQVKEDPHKYLVHEQMMYRDELGLLPGNVYMLYWLYKNINLQAPAYFETYFGIDFHKELRYLLVLGLIDTNARPTEFGCEQIDDYHEFLKETEQVINKLFIDSNE